MTGADRINRMIKSTHKRLNWLAYVSAFGGFALVLLFWIVLSLTGTLDLFSPKLRAAATLAIIFIGSLLLIRSIRTYTKPTIQQAFEQVDALSENRPASTLIDNPVRPHERAAQLWSAHRERVSVEAENLPRPSLWNQARAIDPFFLRFLTPLLLFASIAFASSETLPRLKKTFSADYGTLVGADKLSTQAWVAPPAYTGQAPFDVSTNQTFTAPTGSVFTIRVETHGSPKLKLFYGDKTKTLSLERGADGVFETQLTLDLQKNVRAEIHWWGERAAYDITSNVDKRPVIDFTEYPHRDENDRTAFGWSGEDDYGISKVELLIRPAKPRPGEEEIFDTIVLDIPGIEPQKANNNVGLNLTRHKWAGLPVIAELQITDAANQSSKSRQVTFQLPEKLFLQPMAKAAMEVRNVVLRDWNEYSNTDLPAAELMDDGQIKPVLPSKLEKAPTEVRRASIMLDALTYKPETYFNDPIVYMGLRQAKQIIATADNKPEADASEEILWSVAMRAEYESLASAAQALEAARKALETALRDGASEDEIKRLMQAYRQAVQNYIDMRVAEAMRRGVSPEALDGESPAGKMLGGSDIQDMLDTLSELSETGAVDQARQLLSDMSALLDGLKDLQLRDVGEGGDPLSDIQPPMAQALEDLAEELRDQRDLNDDTKQAQREQNGSSGQTDGQNTQSNSDLANRQQELMNRETGNTNPDSNGMTSGEANNQPNSENGDDYAVDEDGYRIEEQGNAMSQAKEAQKRAAEALAAGDLETAMRHQKQAEQALTRAATEMAEASDKMKAAQGNANAEDAQASDPLGRPTGQGMVGDGDEIKVPDKLDRQRAHEILKELRERSADSGLTAEELDYLLRLLKRF